MTPPELFVRLPPAVSATALPVSAIMPELSTVPAAPLIAMPAMKPPELLVTSPPAISNSGGFIAGIAINGAAGTVDRDARDEATRIVGDIAAGHQRNANPVGAGDRHQQ